MFNFFKKERPEKIYASGVTAIREVPFRENSSKLILAAKADEFADWIRANQNSDGYINIDITPKKNVTEGRTHIAYLNYALTHHGNTSQDTQE